MKLSHCGISLKDFLSLDAKMIINPEVPFARDEVKLRRFIEPGVSHLK